VGRPKKIDVITSAPGPSDGAEREVWEGIDNLLVFGNGHREAIQKAPELVADIDRCLLLLSDFQGGRFDIRFKVLWPGWAALALKNLSAFLKKRALYLRRCSECALWFVARDARRAVCYRQVCKLARSRERTAASRVREREARERARRAVTRKGTRRTS
jgi:hypothetical protein